MRHAVLAALLLLATRTSVAAESSQRTLTFEDRVRAQEAIERVYYSHQLGTTKPFEQAVARSVLEGKVRRYLDETAALNVYWKTVVTDEMLQRELERMAAGTRMPERLLELYAALGNDLFLIKECLARASLVDRLTHNFYAFDQTFHADARRRAEELHRQLSSGQLSPLTEHLNRSVVEYVMSESTTRPSKSENPARFDTKMTKPLRHELSPEGFRKQRSQLPEGRGHVSVVTEEPDAFVLTVVLSESPRDLCVASYASPKRTWDDWWETAKVALREESVHAVATNHARLPIPTAGLAIDGRSDPLVASGLPCALDETWTPTSISAPSGRFRHTAVWTGSLMVVWGGEGDGRYQDTGGRYDPATNTWTATSTTNAPTGRSGHTAVWTGSVMVVWGGYGGNGNPDDNTGGRYDPATDTWTPTSTTGVPTARSDHRAVWTGTVMVVWGGYRGGFLNTGGRYNPTTDSWAPTSTTRAPSPRYSHTAVWTGNVMVVWGGYDGNVDANTGGRYDPATDSWTPTSTGANVPPGRYGHTAVWTGSQMVVWGGSGQSTGGRYDPVTDTWKSTSMTGAPQWSIGHTAVWTGSLMIVWGGEVSGPSYLDTGGRYDPLNDSWTPTSEVGVPSGRFYHTAVWTGSVMVVWGGSNSSYSGSFLDTGGRYDPVSDSWTPTSGVGVPSSRFYHTFVWTGSVMVVWGGGGTSGFLDTGGRYDPATDTWTATSTTNAPSGRYLHTAVWTGSVMVVWGGYSGGGYQDRGGRYDPATDTWTSMSTTGAPSPSNLFTSVWTGSVMVVWGGASDAGYLNTGARYDPVSNRWTPTATTGAPTGRAGHTAVWTGSLMVVWGGFGGGNSGGRYDPATDSWTPTSDTDAPSARSDHSAVWTGDMMVVWGGSGGGGFLDTGGRYDPATDTWTETSTTAAPTARYQHTAVWTGSVIVVWGGLSGDSALHALNTGARYDPVNDRWTPTATTGAPAGRYAHAAVWTGSVMVVWAGSDYSRLLDTGGRYSLGSPTSTWYRDLDSDGYGDAADSVTIPGCDGPPGYVSGNTDCDDTDAAVHPGGTENCNAIDDDCDVEVDEGGNALCDDQSVCTEDICQGAAGCSNLLLDHDGDRVCDASDHCAATILTPTVVIGTCDSGVGNHLFPNGCNFGDQVAACRAGARNHGQFVSCVTHLVDAWKQASLITGQQGSRIVRCSSR